MLQGLLHDHFQSQTHCIAVLLPVIDWNVSLSLLWKWCKDIWFWKRRLSLSV